MVPWIFEDYFVISISTSWLQKTEAEWCLGTKLLFSNFPDQQFSKKGIEIAEINGINIKWLSDKSK